MRNLKLKPNPKKEINIEVHGVTYARYPIKTHLITKDDNIVEVIKKYTRALVEKGDIIVVGESIVAICQGRAIPIKDIKVSFLANFLVKFVYKAPYGIGLGSPWTMQLALEEVGIPRILLAAFFSALTKPFGIRGVFYKVAGIQASSIDGPADYVIPPYNKYAIMGPKEPNKVAKQISQAIGVPVIIVDASDLGCKILGESEKIDHLFIKKVLKDNPLGQTSEQTPIGIIRRVT